MKRLLLIAITLLLLGSMGYFATQNSHNVSLNLFGNFSIQLSVWMVIAGSFVAGWAVTELWQFISHPQRFVQSFLGKFSQYRDVTKTVRKNCCLNTQIFVLNIRAIYRFYYHI